MHQTLRRVKDFTRIPAGEQVTVCWSLSSLHHIHRDFAKKMNNDFGDKFGDKNNAVSSTIRRNKKIKKFGRRQNPQANVNMYGGLNDQKNETLKDQNPEAATDSVRHNRETTTDIQQVKYLVLEPDICCTSHSFCNHFVGQVIPLVKMLIFQTTFNESNLQHEFLIVDKVLLLLQTSLSSLLLECFSVSIIKEKPSMLHDISYYVLSLTTISFHINLIKMNILK